MNYFYFNPFSKQYYFPEGFKNIPLFQSFYQPYTSSGRLLWFVWKNSSLVRRFFREKAIEDILPINRFKKYIPATSILAINRGTPGIEQKMSVLAYDPENGKEYFIKYADSEIACINVENEGKILAQLNHLDFVPKLQHQVSRSDYALIQTNILKGERLLTQNVDKQLLQVLLTLVKEDVNTEKKFETELISCFAHGDFCPWNMMLDGDQLNIFDWEMAGTYPLGFDMFTFIFQTSFLLRPKVGISQLIKETEPFIKSYFEKFKISDWSTFLNAFASIKLDTETQKNNQRLIPFYMQLHNYAKKT